MKRFFLLIGIFLIFGCGGGSSDSSKLLIPAYFYDYSLWERLFNKDYIVVVNPNNGFYYDGYYEDIVKNLSHPYGYVATNYSNRSIEEVKNEIDNWIKFYEIEGIFLDEVDENLSYYKELSEFIKSFGKRVILNSGRRLDDKFYDFSDIIIVYEGDFSGYNSEVCKNSKDGVIVYGASEEDYKKAKKCRYYYFTDSDYHHLPSYLDEE